MGSQWMKKSGLQELNLHNSTRNGAPQGPHDPYSLGVIGLLVSIQACVGARKERIRGHLCVHARLFGLSRSDSPHNLREPSGLAKHPGGCGPPYENIL